MPSDRLSSLIRLQAALTLAVDTAAELPDADDWMTPALSELLEWAKTESALAMGEAQRWPVAD
jgi:hypothetical protein